jgi:hypothetical protein
MQFRIFCLPVCYLKTSRLKYTKNCNCTCSYVCEIRSLALRYEHIKSKELRRIFASKSDEVTGD